MEVIHWASIVSGLNIVLLLTLLVVYIRNYLKLKSKFCLGLILFAAVFLIHCTMAIYFQTNLSHYYKNSMENIALALNILEALGMGTLLYITWRPCM